MDAFPYQVTWYGWYRTCVSRHWHRGGAAKNHPVKPAKATQSNSPKSSRQTSSYQSVSSLSNPPKRKAADSPTGVRLALDRSGGLVVGATNASHVVPQGRRPLAARVFIASCPACPNAQSRDAAAPRHPTARVRHARSDGEWAVIKWDHAQGQSTRSTARHNYMDTCYDAWCDRAPHHTDRLDYNF